MRMRRWEIDLQDFETEIGVIRCSRLQNLGGIVDAVFKTKTTPNLLPGSPNQVCRANASRRTGRRSASFRTGTATTGDNNELAESIQTTAGYALPPSGARQILCTSGGTCGGSMPHG